MQSVISFAASAVKAFSDVEQSAGAVESVFQGAAESITSQAEGGAAEAFGLSASQFQESAALIGSMLKNQMGLSAEEAAGKVDDLTGKAADMAATFGGTTAEAIQAIGSLLRGERDPIERYGVSMNDAAISARALELGLEDATGAIGPAAKATAALDILNQQTADSAGQFARESDTLAGSQQILAANVENAKAAIGEELAPAVSAAMGAMQKLMPVVESLTSALGGVSDATVPLIDQLTIMFGIAPETGVGLETVGGALAQTILPFLLPVTAGFHNINEVLGLNAKANEDALRAMEDTRTHGVDPLIEAEEDLEAAIRDTITVRQEANDQIRASIDPFFALIAATDAQKEAQAAVNTLVRKGADKDNPALIESLKTLAIKSLDMEEAELRLLAAGGLTREEFERQRVAMGLSAAEAQILIDKYDILFTDRTVTFTTQFKYTGTQPTADNPFRVPGQHTGGVVPGVPGSEVPIMARAGEFVSQGGRDPHGNGHGGPIVVQLVVDGKVFTEQVVVPQLARYSRRNGSLGF